MFWFGLDPSDSNSISEITKGVLKYRNKYSYVYLEYTRFEGFLKQQMGCIAIKCGILVKNDVKYRMNDNGFLSLTAANIEAFLNLD